MSTEEKKQPEITQSTTKGTDKPLPDPPRNKEDRDKIRVFALVVAINDYQEGIPKLGGCVKDAELVANYLRKQYGTENIVTGPMNAALNNDPIQVEQHFKGADQLSLQLCVLLDEEATYENILRAFEEHLVNNPAATGHDSFWFHFSGHGTEQFTAEEFYKPHSAGGSSLVPDGKDQSLVCYNGAGTSNIFLADKEIGIMLERIHTNVRNQGEHKKPHIVVTLDCCHSGSGTRDHLEPEGLKTRNVSLFKSRNWEEALQEQNAVRKIESYYPREHTTGNGPVVRGAFVDENGNAKPYIPMSQHLLMAACSNAEKAGDMPRGGVFTNSLIGVLHSKPNGEVNYAELFADSRMRATAKRKNQTLQMEPIDGFNPYTAFLEGWALGSQQKYAVRSKTNRRGTKTNWFVRCGAVNGLPMDTSNEGKIQVQIYNNRTNEVVGNAHVAKVGMQDSRILLEEGLELITYESQNALEEQDKVTYHARLFTLPATPVYVLLEGKAEAPVLQALEEQWNNEGDIDLQNFNIIVVEESEEDKNPHFKISADEQGNLSVSEVETGQHWFTQIPGSAQLSLLKENLFKLVRWQRFLDLKNEASRLSDEFDFELRVGDWPSFEAANEEAIAAGKEEIDKEAESDIPRYMNTIQNVYRGQEVKVYGTEDSFHINEDDDFEIESFAFPFFFRFRYKKPDKERYFYIFAMLSDGTIQALDSNFNHKIESTKEGQVIDYVGRKIFEFRLPPELQTATLIFKIFVATDPIDQELLTQDPFILGGERGDDIGTIAHSRNKTSTADQWCVHTMKVTVAQQTNEIDQNKPAELGEGAIKINVMEADLKARANLVSADGNSRSLDPIGRLTRFEETGMKIVPFSRDRSVSSDNILELELENPEQGKPRFETVELTKADGTTETVRQAKALMQVRLEATPTANDEVYLPLAFDGQHFKVVGDLASSESGSVDIPIRELPVVKTKTTPDGQLIENPFGPEELDRSLFKALKMAFFKLALKKNPDDLNDLRWVQVKPDGTVERTETALAARVEKAKRILLVIHGIIGNTSHMIEPIAGLLDLPASDEDSDFLMLTFDYENLNTSIRKTSQHLKEKLEAVGLGAGHKKELTILAHSMGGLVSRSMIELEGGKDMVQHLIMAGTPNNGSPFGKIEGARSMAVRLLEISANFVPNLIPFSGYILKGLQGAAAVFNTLGEMDADSEFLKALNNSGDPGVQYSILAGNANNYDAPGEGFGNFMENLQLRIGDIANRKDAHDIAVPVDSIENRAAFGLREPKPVIPADAVVCHHLNYFTNDASRARLKELLNF